MDEITQYNYPRRCLRSKRKAREGAPRCAARLFAVQKEARRCSPLREMSARLVKRDLLANNLLRNAANQKQFGSLQ